MKITNIPPDMSKVPGGWLTNESPVLLGCKAAPKTTEIEDSVWRIDNFISAGTVAAINAMMRHKESDMAPVSIQGLQNVTPETTGSWRTTMFNEEMADGLYRLFRHTSFPKSRLFSPFDSTDWHQGDRKRNTWKWVGVSPVLRYMRYKQAGRHAVHYDCGYIYPDDNIRTLMSFVLYLSTNKTGATRIIDDGQKNIPVWDRNHADWSREATEGEILAESLPVEGSVLLFDHRVPHDVELYDGVEGDRIIIRGDLIFAAV